LQKTPKTKRLLGTWKIDSSLIRQIVEQASCGRRRKFRKNEMLYEQGTTSTKFYLVLSGLAQVSIVRVDGVEVVLEYMGPETILGEGAAFDGLPKFSSAVAVEDTDTIEFDAAKMEEVFKEHPGFAAALLRVTSLKQRVLAVRLEHLASRKPEVRIMDLLHRLQEMFAIDYAGGRLIVTHLTHEQISAMTGTSRVTVTRAMRSLREQNQIDIIDGHILVKVFRPC
jgi:CRP/FNR family cyclic AMP-dependent transcriptional regulator